MRLILMSNGLVKKFQNASIMFCERFARVAKYFSYRMKKLFSRTMNILNS